MCIERAEQKNMRPSSVVRLVVLIVVGAGGVSACASKTDDATSNTGASGGTASEEASPGPLAATIKAELNSDEQLRDSNLDVTANAQRKEATLSGTVESEAVKARAVETVKAAHPDLAVNAKIEVKSGCCGSERRRHLPGPNGMPGDGHGMGGMPGDGQMRK